MSKLITVPEISSTPLAPVINEEGKRVKAELLAKSHEILAVTTVEEGGRAIIVAGTLRRHIKEIEDTRVAIKEPFLVMGRAIDAAAKEHVAELNVQLNRINSLVGQFEEARRREQEAQERARRAEEARIAAEAEKARLEALRLEEEARKKQLALEAKGKEPTEAQKTKALEAQLDAQEKQEAFAAEQQRLANERLEQQRQSEAARPTGGALKEEIDITVTDIHALYRAEPACVKMTPDLSMIKTFIKANRCPAGVSFTKRPVFSARAR